MQAKMLRVNKYYGRTEWVCVALSSLVLHCDIGRRSSLQIIIKAAVDLQKLLSVQVGTQVGGALTGTFTDILQQQIW